LMFSEVKQYYEIVDDKAKIYKKIGPK
jgi:hypothetical protein